MGHFQNFAEAYLMVIEWMNELMKSGDKDNNVLQAFENKNMKLNCELYIFIKLIKLYWVNTKYTQLR